MGTKEFFQSEKRILLAGNGISDAQKIDWSDMLSFIQEKLFAEQKIQESEKIEDINSISPTLFFESLAKKAEKQSEREKELRLLVKEYVGDKSNFVHKLWQIYNIILTTNFDNNLVISKADIIENELDPKEKHLTYEDRFLYRRLNFTYDKSLKSVFFIHGYFKNPDTICLGYEQYTDNLKKIEDFVIKNYSDKNYKKKKNNKSISWIDYFFKDNTTIDILGLSLCNEEIDLWWILNYRKKILHRIKNNRINYYDIPIDEIKDEEALKKRKAKDKVLKSFGVKVVEIDKARKHNSDFYSLCLKKIKEEIKNN
ncbi:MAG: hypothetical protein K5829_05935 [Treponema sp.]|nr:hypothetical protein [Treponema sp.]